MELGDVTGDLRDGVACGVDRDEDGLDDGTVLLVCVVVEMSGSGRARGGP